MTKEEAYKFSEELGELSEFEEQNKERMKEIAHVLVAYYMGGKPGNAKSVGKRPQEKTLGKDIASNVEI